MHEAYEIQLDSKQIKVLIVTSKVIEIKIGPYVKIRNVKILWLGSLTSILGK
jgi:hypothetical protein